LGTTEAGGHVNQAGWRAVADGVEHFRRKQVGAMNGWINVDMSKPECQLEPGKKLDHELKGSDLIPGFHHSRRWTDVERRSATGIARSSIRG
jgi:hypothetical protein